MFATLWVAYKIIDTGKLSHAFRFAHLVILIKSVLYNEKQRAN